ncbi:enoyl-CoA hydratase-related protein [Frankia sp. Cr1]|uniref:enoyl-CoA hydratase-related protein n=1 Tax=Frankia sp. Cr1 TaxID=3073931 RepID=UPI002AD356E9|nr:enoyl-CoA hydratase-related protein [Frankia sp. Cr1]
MTSRELTDARSRELTDVRYEVDNGLAWITIDREARYNAFSAHTVDELIHAFKLAWGDSAVGVVCLTGAGEKAFCAGGDVKMAAEFGGYGPTDYGIFEIQTLHRVMRAIPKPMIAAVNGVSAGGGHVLHVLCDLSIAADTATFGQSGPRVGSWDAGFGTGILARAIGEKRAREMWYLCRRYDAAQALEWGLVNAVVPLAELQAEVRRWAGELLERSPTALAFLKHSFNADTEQLAGVGAVGFDALDIFVHTREAQEGKAAFAEKRPPDFARFR